MKRSLAVLALATAAIPATARAQAEEKCAPAAAHVCVTVLFTLSGGNTINAFIYNGSGGEGASWQSSLSQFAIGSLPTTGTWSLAGVHYNDWNSTTLTLDSDGSTALASDGGWSFSSGFADLSMTTEAGADGPGGNGGVVPCAGGPSGGGTKFMTCEGDGTAFGTQDDWLEISFVNSLGGLTQTTLDDLSWAFKVQDVQGLSGNSFECNEVVGTDKFCSTDDISIPQGGDAVPEPATMSLLAFGMTGLAAVGRRRRRKTA
ncbi:MAG TPA: PEP-CTERM sorting domain-containing protein [Gemmatimonadales bacterium]